MSPHLWFIWSHAAVLSIVENPNPIAATACRALSGLCGGWGEKFYIINNQYWLHFKPPDDSAVVCSLTSSSSSSFNCVPSSQPKWKKKEEAGHKAERSHTWNPYGPDVQACQSRMLILFVKSSSREADRDASSLKRHPPQPATTATKTLLLYYQNM